METTEKTEKITGKEVLKYDYQPVHIWGTAPGGDPIETDVATDDVMYISEILSNSPKLYFSCASVDPNKDYLLILRGGRYTAEQLATEFTQRLIDELTPDEMRELRAKTRNMSSKGVEICYSHDYTDANMLMWESVKALAGLEVTMTGKEGRLINEAWNIAKKRNFTNGVDEYLVNMRYKIDLMYKASVIQRLPKSREYCLRAIEGYEGTARRRVN